MPQEKHVTFKRTATPPAQKASLFLLSRQARGQNVGVLFLFLSQKDIHHGRRAVFNHYQRFPLETCTWGIKWKSKCFLFPQPRPPASSALLRLYNWLPNDTDGAGAWHGCTLLWSLCCPLRGQQQLLMLQTVLDEPACLLIKLDMELSTGVNNLLGPLPKA